MSRLITSTEYMGRSLEEVKALDCLMAVWDLTDKQGISLEEIFQGVAELIPLCFKHPKLIGSRIIFEDKEYRSGNFENKKLSWLSHINMGGKRVGLIEVCCLGESPGQAEEFFLQREQKLVARIAQRLPNIVLRKRVEEQLRQSEEKSRRILEYANESIVVTDFNGVIFDTNEKLVELHGFKSKDEVLGQIGYRILIADRDRRRAIENIRRCLEQESVSNIECTLRRADGTEFPGEMNVSLLRDDSGTPIGFVGVDRDITQRKQLRDKMQLYISEITKAQEDERRRISQELHDDTAQSLAILSLEIDAISRADDQLSKQTRKRLSQLKTRAETILEEVRRFGQALRPMILDQFGFIPALDLLIENEFKKREVTVTFNIIGCAHRLSPESELVLFRIAQEALRNIEKHAHATEVIVQVEFRKKSIKLNITDNGMGFAVPKELSDFAGKGKLGLLGMLERVRLLNGSFSVKSRVGSGTTVAVYVQI